MTWGEVACFEGHEVRDFIPMRKTVALFMDFLNLDGNNFCYTYRLGEFQAIYLNKVMSLKRLNVTVRRLILLMLEHFESSELCSKV